MSYILYIIIKFISAQSVSSEKVLVEDDLYASMMGISTNREEISNVCIM